MTIDDDRRSPRIAALAVLLGMVGSILLLASSWPSPGLAAANGLAGGAQLALVATPKPSPGSRAGLISLAEATAERHGVDHLLVHAVILAESAYDPKALSHKGAMGLMQLIPATAARYGVADPWDPAQNLDGGVRYLRDLLRQFKQRELAFAAYNAGENAVERHGNSIPPYQETATYVARTAAYLERLETGASVAELIAKGVPGRPLLSGWGLIFGFFYERKDALDMVRQQRNRLAGVLAGGRSAIVPRELDSGQRYAALLVGLDEAEAGQACRHLQALEAHCLALTPSELTDPAALWGR